MNNRDKNTNPVELYSPHHENSSSMVSNLIKRTLKLPGLSRLGQFGGSSTRSTFTAKANLGGLPVFYLEVHGPTNLLGKSSVLKTLFLLRKYSKQFFFLLNNNNNNNRGFKQGMKNCEHA